MRPGPHRPDGPAEVVDQQALAAVLDAFAATVTGEFAPEDLLRELASGAVRVLDVDGAGVMVPKGDGLLRFACATGPVVEAVRDVERLQELLAAGPCRDVQRSQRPVHVGDLAVEGEWPAFQDLAVEVGLHAVTAIPLLARGRIWGVLDLYRCRPGRFTREELAAAQTLANLATSYLVVTDDRDRAREAQDQLAHLAMHDPLTGLPVRWVFLEQLTHALARLERHPGHVGLLFADLDGLKYVNDRYGHLAGDRLLQTCVDRVRAALRPQDVVARLGGDEFVVLLEDVDGPDAVGLVARRIQDELARPYRPEGQTIQPSASIGAALTCDARTTPDTLLAHADSAMYRAKRRERGGFEFFDPDTYAEDHSRAVARDQVAGALRIALREGRLELHYQPIFDVDAGADTRSAALYGVEALARWRHPERGLLVAADFVEQAERAGLMVDLGAWAVRSACRQLAAWDAVLQERAPRRMFVNVSVSELASPGLAARVSRCLQESGVEPGRLTLEITETGVISGRSAAGTALTHLQDLGCGLAIDDFGTGHSSLSRLARIPAGILKVDRSFTSDLLVDRAAGTVVSAVLLLGRDLGRTVVVEGVEDQPTLAALRGLGATHVQGFHLGRPLPPDEVTALLTGP